MNKPTNPNELVPIFNPMSHDFSYPWKDDSNTEHILFVPSINIVYFPRYQADFMAKHLADEIINERGYAKDKEKQRKEVLSQIYVTI